MLCEVPLTGLLIDGEDDLTDCDADAPIVDRRMGPGSERVDWFPRMRHIRVGRTMVMYSSLAPSW